MARLVRDLTVLPAHPRVYPWQLYEPYLLLPSQPKLILIFPIQENGRLIRPHWQVTYQHLDEEDGQWSPVVVGLLTGPNVD